MLFCGDRLIHLMNTGNLPEFIGIFYSSRQINHLPRGGRTMAVLTSIFQGCELYYHYKLLD